MISLKIIDRYLALTVIKGSLNTLLVLVALRCLFELPEEISDVGMGTYSFVDAVVYVLLLIPGYILELFPMAVLIGSLFGLGMLANNSELTVLRAAGLSVSQITTSCVKAILILMVLVVGVSEGIAPQSSERAQQLKIKETSGGSLMYARNGAWLKDGGRIISVRNIVDQEHMVGIDVFITDGNNRIEAILEAHEMLLIEKGKWKLTGVKETQFNKEKLGIKWHKELPLDLNVETEQVKMLALNPDTLNVLGLLDYIEYLQANDLDYKPYQLAFWQKLVLPFSLIVMMYLACSFIFGPMRETSMGARIMTGVMVGFAFHLTNSAFGPISLVFKMPVFLGALIPLIIFGYIAKRLIRKAK